MPVRVRALVERTFHPKRVEAWFEQTAEAQYTPELWFSTLFELMRQGVCRVRRSVHEAYQAAEHMATSVGAGYRTLARIEPTPVAALVRYSAQERRAVLETLESTQPSPLPGYGVKLLDGKALATPAHRLKVLPPLRAGALPGNAVVVYAPACTLRGDLGPCEAGQTQERALVPALVETVQPGAGWIGDRNFWVTAFLVGIAARGAYLMVREHDQIRFPPHQAMRDGGRVESGTVAEQRVGLTRAGQATQTVRRSAVRLDRPTRAGDTTGDSLTNLPAAVAPATVGARRYRGRWRLETAFQVLATALTSESDPLAYPKAALVGVAVAVVTDTVVAPAKAVLAKGHGADPLERGVSDYAVAAALDAVAAGLAVAVPAPAWQVLRPLPVTEFVAFLLPRAHNVRLARFRKPPRGPKKLAPTQSDAPKPPHVATAKLIATRK